ncbi:MAG: sulfur oxidation c-type cytochrome SoxX [Burkholderiales bacterium]
MQRVAIAVAAGLLAGVFQAQALEVDGDGVREPLAPGGDAARGRALIVARESANCVLCHAVPDAAVRFAGNVGPSLAGVGSRLTAAQLRLRIADSTRLDPDSVMPSYFRTEGLVRVASAYEGKPVLSAREVEDLVAYLVTLR